jgi:hypothetical protein
MGSEQRDRMGLSEDERAIDREGNDPAGDLDQGDVAAEETTSADAAGVALSSGTEPSESTVPPGRPEGRQPLIPEDRTSSFRERWEQIQAHFVDEPRKSVEEADELVTELIEDLQTSFSTTREGLETQWQRGDEASTEDLRLSLQAYRSFFDRLLGT